MKTIRIDYPPTSLVRWGPDSGYPAGMMKMFAAHEDTHRAFIRMLSGYEADFRAIPTLTDDDTLPRWQQSWFFPLDGMSSYALVADRKPGQLIEIGSGNSTKFFAHARRNHAPDMVLHSIDPFPRAEINGLCDHIHRIGLEAVDLSLFDRLEPGDMVFFDGSHRAFQNSDVTVFFLDVLPRLAPGITVGIHDVFLPRDYPEDWIPKYYNEQYMLGAYMVPFGTRFPLVAACHYVHKFMADALKEAFSPDLIACFPEKIAQRVPARINGSCFWFETRQLT
ncbi:MAG: class I SAM-dependent methyltransferase [Jannaschia sp.]